METRECPQPKTSAKPKISHFLTPSKFSVIFLHFPFHSNSPRIKHGHNPNPLHLQAPPIPQLHSQLRKRPNFETNFAHFTPTKPPRLVIRAAGTDYYKTLNLDRNATLKEIKTSYRKLALQYHPDLNKDSGAEEKVKEITAAYEVLSDDEKRTAYDRSGDAGLQGDYGSWTTGSTGVTFQFYGTGESGGINVNVKSTGSQIYEIRFKEPIVIKVSFAEAFETCGGSGAESKSNVEACDACAGSGVESDNCIKSCTGSGGTGGLGTVIATAVTVSIILFLGLAAIIPGKRSSVVKMIAKQEVAYKSGTSANE